MKFLTIITSIFLIILNITVTSSTPSSILKIDIVEAVNLHCKLNDEFYCNPYAIIKFKYSSESKTTKRIECTKHPKWESQFSFEPEYCQDVIYIYFYQYLTPRDSAYLGSAVENEERFEQGEVHPGYLGRVMLDLEKLPFGMIDDWFMIESPTENRIVFPSCIHLRLSWTSSTCQEPSQSSIYQIDSIRNSDEDSLPEKFEPKNFLPMCKKDFAVIYQTKFSRLDREGSIKKTNEIEIIDEKKRIEFNCKIDSNEDYGFLHKFSNLTSLEEALVYKIIKRTTGEYINYEEFANNFSIKNHKKYIKSYKEFFEKECFKREELTVERINNILKNDAEQFPQNTTNPYLTLNLNELDYPLMLNKKMMANVYNDTLDQFYALEDIKNLDTMDDDTYLQTMNKMVEVMKDIKAEKKIDSTLFHMRNKVMLTNEGRVDKKEERFFRIYSLYKWNGGQFEYDEIKREYMIRRKYFYCYEIIKVMPTNILFQFIDDCCPDNYVCVDPNGIVIKSKGRNPRKVFQTDIEKNGLNFFINMHGNKVFDGKKPPVTNLRFKSLESKKKGNEPIMEKSQLDLEIEKSDSKDDDVLNFEKLLQIEAKEKDPQISNAIVEKEDDSYRNKFDQLYIQRQIRIKKKKEIIINKVYSNVPLIGEVIALANLDVLDKNINHKFLQREINLMKKYLLIYNSQIPHVEKAAQILVDLILCNTDRNKVRYLIRELLEGLCFGDSRSIKIFEEIVRTIIIDSLIQTPYYHFDELHAKVNLVKTLNKPFCFKAIIKIRFVETMIMMDAIKERITYILWNNDTNKKISFKIHDTELSIPVTLPNNQRLFDFNPEKSFDNVRDINKNYLNEIERIKKFDENTKGNKESNPAGFKFKSIETVEVNKNITKINKNNLDDEILSKVERMRREMEEEVEENHYDNENENDDNQNENKPIQNRENDEEDLMNEFAGVFNNIHFKQKEENSNLKSKNNSRKSNKLKFSKFPTNSTSVPKFKSVNFNEDQDIQQDNFNQNTENSDEFAKVSLNQYNNPDIYQKHDDPNSSILEATNPPNSEDILNKVMRDPQTRKIIEDTKTNPTNKILFPKEIHSTYEVNKKGTKQVTINKDNKTKKLILDKLMDEKTFNEMMDQDECNTVDDQTGLYNVLKNIQNKKCSCDFLCIEIGTIYGPFDSLRPKNVTVMTNHKENIQLIIKPVIVVNHTVSHYPAPITPQPAPIVRNITGLFEDEDCDVLKMSSLVENSNIFNQNMRFKELVDKNKHLSNIQRKFYRKVEYGNEILATEIFKQGLNVIILKREKGYKKIYERTYNTNVDPIESDAMACILRDAGHDKIIVITGIGKWMGSITPRLIKEIKQIGGPDLNRLVSVDSEDNSMADHAFILIGRRGLCRYNGVFRVKNYDISRELKTYFPDLSSDPNDCYFENMTFENEKNKHSEKQFFHVVDLRLTLNLSNDSRFSYKAPTVISVTPPSGYLNGGTCIQIRGMNFGSSAIDIKEVLVRGVVCKDVVVLSPNVISCTTGSSTIMGAGIGNVQIKLMCGLSSPANTCSMFEYSREQGIVEQPAAIIEEQVPVADIAHVVVRPMIKPMIMPRLLPPPIPAMIHPHYPAPYPAVIHPYNPHPHGPHPHGPHPHGPHPIGHHLSPPMPLFSFKEKKYDQEGNPDMNDIMKNINSKLFAQPEPNNQTTQKIDNLVTDNFKHLLTEVNNNEFATPRDGFRKKRFSKLVSQLK